MTGVESTSVFSGEGKASSRHCLTPLAHRQVGFQVNDSYLPAKSLSQVNVFTGPLLVSLAGLWDSRWPVSQ